MHGYKWSLSSGLFGSSNFRVSNVLNSCTSKYIIHFLINYVFLWVSRPGLKLGMLHACWGFCFLFFYVFVLLKKTLKKTQTFPSDPLDSGKSVVLSLCFFLSEGKVSILLFSPFSCADSSLSAPGSQWSAAAIWLQLLLLLVSTFSVWMKSALHFWAVVVELTDDKSLGTDGTNTISIFHVYCLTHLCLCQSRLCTAVLGLKFPYVKWFQSGPCSALRWDYHWECPVSESLRQKKTIWLTAFEIFSHYCVFIISSHHLSGCTEWVHELNLTPCSRWAGLNKKK